MKSSLLIAMMGAVAAINLGEASDLTLSSDQNSLATQDLLATVDEEAGCIGRCRKRRNRRREEAARRERERKERERREAEDFKRR